MISVFISSQSFRNWSVPQDFVNAFCVLFSFTSNHFCFYWIARRSDAFHYCRISRFLRLKVVLRWRPSFVVKLYFASSTDDSFKLKFVELNVFQTQGLPSLRRNSLTPSCKNPGYGLYLFNFHRNHQKLSRKRVGARTKSLTKLLYVLLKMQNDNYSSFFFIEIYGEFLWSGDGVQRNFFEILDVFSLVFYQKT